MGFWDGSASAAPVTGTGGWDDFAKLEPATRLAVLSHETANLLLVEKVGATVRLVVSGKKATPLLVLTPPSIAHLQSQLVHLRTAADLRADRMAEILAQQNDLVSFFASLFNLHPERKRWTHLLLTAMHRAVVVAEARAKLFCSLPRPYDFTTQLQPVILTPSHSAYPSGHATEAFAFAAVLSALALAARPAPLPATRIVGWLDGSIPATLPEMMPFRLAARIADNRTVAGLHFPVDNAHGALMGICCGLAFVGRCSSTPLSLRTWKADGNLWAPYFTLDTLRPAMASAAWDGGQMVAPPSSPSTSLLGTLWKKALDEWK